MDRLELSLHCTHRNIIVRCGHQREMVDARLIRSYLPDALPLVGRRPYLDLDEYIARSAPVRYNILKAGKMQRLCQELVDILATATPTATTGGYAGLDGGNGSAHDVSLGLSDWLARSMLEDRRAKTAASTVRYPRTLQAFIFLADASREFASRRVGAALHAFFARHGARVVAAEHPQAVFLWGWALLLARVGEPERVACLREVLRARPDVVLVAARYDAYAEFIPNVEELYVAIDRIAERDGVGGRGGGGGGGLGGGGGIGVGGGGFGGCCGGGAGGGGGYCLHEHEEHRLVRSSHRPLGLQMAHRPRRFVDADDLLWKPHGAAGRLRPNAGLRDALDSIQHDQRELRHEMHDVKDGLEDLVHQVGKLGRRGHGRRDWRDMDALDYCAPYDYESEWVTEWWEESY